MYQVSLSGSQSSALVSIGTNISSDNASIANASITSLSVVDFKTAVFSPHTINTSNLNVSSISLDPNFVFPVLNVSTLNSVEEIFVNVSAVNISANQITADNIQPLLTAGYNINISNNVITALNNNLPATGNFTTLNTSQLNASNISTGDLTFGSDFTLSDKFLTVNSTNNITQNSGDLITSGAVFEAFNRFGTNISDGRSLINIKLISGGDVIKPIVPGTTNIIDVDVDPGTSKNIMKVFYTTKLGQDAMLGVVANFAYVVSGNGFDKITARLEYNDGSSGDQNIGQAEQIWADEQGGGTRSGVLSPRIGTRRSGVPAQTQVYFQIIIQNDSNDTFTFLNPDACTFQITESLDNDGSDLNLNTGNLQADEANFNSLTVQPGSRSGQATIGKTFLGNNAFGNMACLSVIGNTGATNYGFAQVAGGNTIMNAMPGSYNSFRSSNNEIASIGDIGLGIALGIGNTASFPLEVGGSALFSGVVFASEFDSNEADLTNISNTNLSGTNATFQEINVSGNLIVNGTTFTTATLTAGENINISNNVISAFFGSGGQVNLNYIQVDGGVDIGGVLNVSQTSNFSNSLNVGDILYAGVAGNHEGSVVLYSNIVGDNYTTKINSSTGEVNCSATGNLNSINFFIGNNRPLEIKNNGIEVTNLQADDITSDTLTTVEAEADVFTCIDGQATFRFNTPQLNATNASISTATIDDIILNTVDATTIDATTGNISTANISIVGANEITSSTIQTLTLDATTLITTPEVDATLVRATNVSSTNITANNAEVMNNLDVYNNLFVANRFDGQIVDANEIIGDTGDFGSLDATIINATTTNTSTLNSSNGNFSSMVVNGTGSFQTVVANNVNVAGTLTANNIQGYQEELTAGSNITIDGNTISATGDLVLPPNPNFSTVTADTITGQTLNTSNINTSTLNSSNGNFGGTLNGNIISCNGLDADEAEFGSVTSFQYNISNNLDDTEASTFIRNGDLTEFIHTGGRLRFSCNELQTSGVANFSTLNASNLSTATMGLSSDFNFDTFSNTLSLATNASQAIADIETNGLTTVSVNTSSLNVDGITTLDIVAISVGLNSTTNNLFNINSSGTANISMINNSTINSKTGNFSTINASNIVGYQETLIAGNNISINGNTINSLGEPLPSNPNFSSVTATSGNFSTINASVINGDNLSTASISFDPTDFNFVNDELSLATSASQIETNTIDTIKSGLTFDAFSTLDGLFVVDSDIISFGQSLDGPTSTITTGNFSTINSSVINGDNLSTASISFDPTDFNFVNGELSLVGSATLPANANFSSVTAEVGNFSTINASNIVGYQETLTAGDGITIQGNTISAQVPIPVNINFSNVNAEQLTVTDVLTTPNTLFVGTNTNSSTPKNIQFGGLQGDNAYNLAVIENRIYDLTEKSELLLFKGNDEPGGSGAGPDRIRLRAAQLDFDTYIGNTDNRTAESIRMSIKDDGNISMSESLTVAKRFDALLRIQTATLNVSTVNASNIVGYQETLIAGSGITINGNTITSTGTQTLPTDPNFSSVTATTGNFSTINASNIVGYQETLTAGNNISIVGNTISASGGTLPADANFSSVTLDTGLLKAPNQVRFKVSRNSGVITFNTVGGTIPFDKTIINIGGGFANNVFTAPVAGTYFFYAQLFTNNNNNYAADFHSGNDVIHPMRRGGTGAGNDTTITGSFYHTLNVGETVFLRLLAGSIKVAFDPITFFGGYLLG